MHAKPSTRFFDHFIPHMRPSAKEVLSGVLLALAIFLYQSRANKFTHATLWENVQEGVVPLAWLLALYVVGHSLASAYAVAREMKQEVHHPVDPLLMDARHVEGRPRGILGVWAAATCVAGLSIAFSVALWLLIHETPDERAPASPRTATTPIPTPTPSPIQHRLPTGENEDLRLINNSLTLARKLHSFAAEYEGRERNLIAWEEQALKGPDVLNRKQGVRDAFRQQVQRMCDDAEADYNAHFKTDVLSYREKLANRLPPGIRDDRLTALLSDGRNIHDNRRLATDAASDIERLANMLRDQIRVTKGK